MKSYQKPCVNEIFKACFMGGGGLWVGAHDGICLASLGSTKLPSRCCFRSQEQLQNHGARTWLDLSGFLKYSTDLVFCTTKIFFNQDQLAYSPGFENGKT